MGQCRFPERALQQGRAQNQQVSSASMSSASFNKVVNPKASTSASLKRSVNRSAPQSPQALQHVCASKQVRSESWRARNIAEFQSVQRIDGQALRSASIFQRSQSASFKSCAERIGKYSVRYARRNGRERIRAKRIVAAPERFNGR